MSDILQELQSEINKSYKGKNLAYFMNGTDDIITDVKEWISTGSILADLAISNRKNGGLPLGRLVEIGGLESCVSPDTLIKVKLEKKNLAEFKTIKISEVKDLLLDNEYTIYVEKNNQEFTKITKYIEKGKLESYSVVLDNDYSIKVSHKHLFFTNNGWVETKQLNIETDKIFCDDNKYHSIKEITNLGLIDIVDITVEHEDHCYFGNGMLNHNSGKSLISAHVAKNTQDKGGVVIYFDTEQAASKEYLQAIGIDFDKMLYIETTDLEKIFNIIEKSVESIRKKNKKQLLTIIIDSISATDFEDNEDKYKIQGYNTQQARLMSKGIKHLHTLISKERCLLLVTTQLRTKLGVSFGDPYCVDPFSTIVKIRYPYFDSENNIRTYKYEELSLSDFSDRFVNNDDFENPEEFDIEHKNIQIETYNPNLNVSQYAKVKSFVVKEPVDSYYTDGKLKGTANHRIIEIKNEFNKNINIETKEVKLKNHSDFKKVNEKMFVVDLEVDQFHSYYANGRLNHNTTASHGMALQFYADVRLRLKSTGKIKAKIDNVEEVIGINASLEVVKNRVGPSFRKIPISYFFDRGIDDFENWLDFLKQYELIEAKNRGSKGTYYVWTDRVNVDAEGNPIMHEFPKKDIRSYLKEHSDVFDQMYNEICDRYIMLYTNKDNINEENIIIDTDDLVDLQ